MFFSRYLNAAFPSRETVAPHSHWTSAIFLAAVLSAFVRPQRRDVSTLRRRCLHPAAPCFLMCFLKRVLASKSSSVYPMSSLNINLEVLIHTFLNCMITAPRIHVLLRSELLWATISPLFLAFSACLSVRLCWTMKQRRASEITTRIIWLLSSPSKCEVQNAS